MKTTYHRNFVLSLSAALVASSLGCSEGEKAAPNKDDDAVDTKTDDEEETGEATDEATPDPTAEPPATDPEPEATTTPVDPSLMVLYGFDTNNETFSLQDYEPGDPMYTNLFYTCSGAEDSRAEQCADINVTWTDEPEPPAGADPGLLQLEIPYTAYNQSVELQRNIDPPMDLTNKFLTVWVKADANGFTPDASAPGGGYVFVKTGEGYTYAHGKWVNFEAETRGQWIKFEMDVSVPEDYTGFDATQHFADDVRSIGVQFSTGGGNDTAAAPTAAVLYLDHFTVQTIEE